MSKLIPNRSSRSVIFIAASAAIVGAFVAGVIWRDAVLSSFGPASAMQVTATTQADRGDVKGSTPKQLWTCSMHPEVIRDGPGRCPICHMALTPMTAASHVAGHATESSTRTVMIEPAMVQRLGVRVATVSRRPLSRVIRASGNLVEPEQLHVDINLRVNGWIQKLYANVDGMAVAEGDPLFDLYSPELTLAVEELIAARKQGGTDSAMLDAARAKVARMGLINRQVEELAKLDVAPQAITFVSPMSGHITAKMVYDGSAVKAGELVLRIADRSQMWADLQVYEQDLPLVKVGDPVTVSLPTSPGEPITAAIGFIHPHFDMMTRSARVRAVLANTGHRLREGMAVSGELKATLAHDAIAVPRESIIDTGARQIAFVMTDAGAFQVRELKLGSSDGSGSVQVLEGLNAGEEVVTSGQFLIDAESRTQEAIEKLTAKHAADSAEGEAR